MINPDACGYCGFDVTAEESRDEALAALRALVAVQDRSFEITRQGLGHPFEHPDWASAHFAAWDEARRIVAPSPRKEQTSDG